MGSVPAMRRAAARRVAGAVSVAALTAQALAGCTSSSDAAGDATLQPMTWHRISLPGGVTPVTIQPMGGSLLVGARDETARMAPQLLVRSDAGWRSIPLEPQSYYAARARWRTVATDGHRIFAVGDAPGGAHSNPRWTTWSGTANGMREHVQTFETFGGWGAGGLTALTFWQHQPLIVGSWSSDTAGLDMVTWTTRGNDWVRHSSTGTALASTDNALNVLRSVGPDNAGNVIAGAVTRLGGGEVSLTPALWRRTAAAPSWSRIDLPAEGESQATGAACQGSACVAAGYDGDLLQVWSVDGDTAQAEADLPALPVDSQSVALVGPQGAPQPAVLAYSGGRSVVLQHTSGGWAPSAGPPGTPTTWAQARGHTFVITTAPDGHSSLWSGELLGQPVG